MTDGAQDLAKFFDNLTKKRKLYNDYLKDPLQTMRAEGLDEDIIGMVLAGDLNGISTLLQSAYPGKQIICGTIVSG